MSVSRISCAVTACVLLAGCADKTHGTPEPDRVGKSYSHGCIRLTNWDVQDLARMVQKGTVVQFLDP